MSRLVVEWMKENCRNVVVSQQQLDEARRLLNALLKKETPAEKESRRAQ